MTPGRPTIIAALFVACASCGDVTFTPLDAARPDAVAGNDAADDGPDGVDAASPDAPPSPTVVFAENFDGIGGANLVGQFGWTGVATVPLGLTGLGGRGVAGRTSPGASSVVAVASHTVDWQPGGIYEVRFRARASNAAPASENTGLFVAAPGDGVVGSGWEYAAGQWHLNLNYIAGGVGPPVAIRDGAEVDFELHLDTRAWSTWGAYTVDGTRLETARYALTQARFATLSGVQVFVDFRTSTVGAEFDDLRITRW